MASTKKSLKGGGYLRGNDYTNTVDKVLDSPKKCMKYMNLTKGEARKSR